MEWDYVNDQPSLEEILASIPSTTAGKPRLTDSEINAILLGDDELQ